MIRYVVKKSNSRTFFDSEEKAIAEAKKIKGMLDIYIAYEYRNPYSTNSNREYMDELRGGETIIDAITQNFPKLISGALGLSDEYIIDSISIEYMIEGWARLTVKAWPFLRGLGGFGYTSAMLTKARLVVRTLEFSGIGDDEIPDGKYSFI